MPANLATVGSCLQELRRILAVSIWVTSMFIGAAVSLGALLLVILSPSTTTYTFAAVVVSHLSFAVTE